MKSMKWLLQGTEHSHSSSSFATTRRQRAFETALKGFLCAQVSLLIRPDFGKSHIKPYSSWQRAKGAFTCS